MAERIGLILVHGIGEQKRYQHLDDELRNIIKAIASSTSPRAWVTVELRDGSNVAFLGDKDTWQCDKNSAPVRATVRTETGDEKHVFFHEVWWADVNEPYSFLKQLRFWWWALHVWFVRKKPLSTRAGFTREMIVPGVNMNWLAVWKVRLQLFWVSFIFSVATLSVGLLVFLAKRLLDFDAPSPVRVFVNYLSCVKLYSQQRRAGGGFLDALDEPPRVSVRRRMMRTLADVALAQYDRWYIVAHSQGTIVAFNGLMESGHAWPNYLDQHRWRALLSNGFAGSARSPGEFGPIADMEPARPLWLDDDEIVYRERIFDAFRGFLTLGSPLNKFATIWPARVPNNRFPAFSPDAWWLNVYDRTDPVSGVLKGYDLRSVIVPVSEGLDSPAAIGHILPKNIGYRAHWLLLYSHIRYLTFRNGRGAVSRLIANVINSGAAGTLGRDFYFPSGMMDRVRRILASLEWVAVFLGVSALSGVAALLLYETVFGA